MTQAKMNAIDLIDDRREELWKYTSPVLVTEMVDDMIQWIEDEGWNNYDSIETWIKGMRVVNTQTLIKIFKGEIK